VIALAVASPDPGGGRPDRHEAEGLDLAAKRIAIQPQQSSVTTPRMALRWVLARTSGHDNPHGHDPPVGYWSYLIVDAAILE